MILWLALAVAAPFPVYGGEAIVLTLGSARVRDPSTAASTGELFVSRAAFETLYEIRDDELIPVLARSLPELTDTGFDIELQSNAWLHDGTKLSADRARDALLRLRGTDAQFAVRGIQSISAEDDVLHFSLVPGNRPDAILRQLSDPRAAVAVSSGGKWLGTGPFAIAAMSTSGLDLVPFARHREGRPFLEKVSLWSSPTEVGARAMIRRGAADAFLDATSRDGEWTTTVLVVHPAHLRSRLSELAMSLSREIIAKRILSDALPISDFSLEMANIPTRAPDRPFANAPLRLFYTDDRGALRKVVERVQLDLVRAGLSPQSHPVSADELDEKRRSGEYDFLLESVALPASNLESRLSILFARYSAGAESFAIEPSKRGEKIVRERLGIIPIVAVRTAPVFARSLRNLRIDDFAIPRFDAVQKPLEH